MQVSFKVSLNTFLSDYFRDEYAVSSIEEVPGGFLSKAYKVIAKNKSGNEKLLFVKAVSNAFAYQKEEDAVAGYLTSQHINDLVNLEPRSLGSLIYKHSQKENYILLETLQENDQVLQIQEYKNGDSLLKYLEKNENLGFSKEVKDVFEKIAEQISKIHKKKIDIDPSRKEQLYKRSLRDVIAHPELTLNVVDTLLTDSKVFTGDFRYQYITEMLKLNEYFGSDFERLSLVHGDFWMTNVLLDENQKPFFIDYSRIVYGEPGVDVGCMYGVLMWFYLLKKNVFYKECADYFLDAYIDATGDTDIVKCATTYLGFVGVVCIVELFYPDATNGDRKSFIEYIFNCLKERKILRKYEF